MAPTQFFFVGCECDIKEDGRYSKKVEFYILIGYTTYTNCCYLLTKLNLEELFRVPS